MRKRYWADRARKIARWVPGFTLAYTRMRQDRGALVANIRDDATGEWFELQISPIDVVDGLDWHQPRGTVEHSEMLRREDQFREGS